MRLKIFITKITLADNSCLKQLAPLEISMLFKTDFHEEIKIEGSNNIFTTQNRVALLVHVTQNYTAITYIGYYHCTGNT